MNKFRQFRRSAADLWVAPLPWWVKGATFGLVFWGSLFIGFSLAILAEHQHNEHIETIIIICWFGSLLFTWKDAVAFVDLPRDCSEPVNWRDMTLYDPAKEILGTSSSDFKKKHFKGLDFDTYRDRNGYEYTRYVYPDGRIRWMRFRQKK